MKPFVILVCVFAIGGCTLSKEESSLSHYDEIAKKKQDELPSGFYTETAVGVHYYPGSDKVRSRQYDEGGAHIVEVILNTTDAIEKVRDFYEKEIGAKAMPTMAQNYTVQKDANGKHYEVGYGQYGSDVTITILVSTATQ
jgi:hypothetical protein